MSLAAMTLAPHDPLPCAGELSLATERRSCFGERAVTLELSWDAHQARLLIDHQERPLPREQLLALAAQLLQAAARPEVTHGGRSTTSHHARLRWRLLADPAATWSAGESSFLSLDLPPDHLQELRALRPDLAARFPDAPYSRAIGLHELATSLATATSPARSGPR